MPDTLSEVEVLALAAIAQLGRRAYGVSIREEIGRRTGRSVSVGSLYKALGRLEDRGLVSTALGEPSAERGGRAKKYVRLEGAGQDALDVAVSGYRRMFDGLDPAGSAS